MKKSRIQYKIYRRNLLKPKSAWWEFIPLAGQRYYDVYLVIGNGEHILLKNYRNRKDRALNFINKLKTAKV
jgi:hypothetical protein